MVALVSVTVFCLGCRTFFTSMYKSHCNNCHFLLRKTAIARLGFHIKTIRTIIAIQRAHHSQWMYYITTQCPIPVCCI